MHQPKEITIHHGRNTLILDDIRRLYDCGDEFTIRLSSTDIKRLLEANIDIAYDLAQYGDDTEVGDRFFEALVMDITGKTWDSLLKQFDSENGQYEAYEFVKLEALKKGFKGTE